MEVAAVPRPGLWFAPTGEELIDILDKKANNKPIPVHGIHDVDITRDTPKSLSETYPKLGVKEWYFFTTLDRKYPNGKRPDRRCGNGFLKATQGDTFIYSPGGELVGFRKKLVFFEGRHDSEPTDWKIDEYRLNRPPRTKTAADDMKLDIALIRIYQRKYRKRKRQEHHPVPENTAAKIARNSEVIEIVDDPLPMKAATSNARNEAESVNMVDDIQQVPREGTTVAPCSLTVQAREEETSIYERNALHDGAPPAIYELPEVGGFDFPDINFRGTGFSDVDFSIPFATSTTTGDARNQKVIEIVDDGVPVNYTTTDIAFEMQPQLLDSADFDFPDISFDADFRDIDFPDISFDADFWDIDFPAVDFGFPLPPDDIGH